MANILLLLNIREENMNVVVRMTLMDLDASELGDLFHSQSLPESIL